MSKSHAIASDVVTPAQMKEFFAQVESGKITRARLQEFLGAKTTGLAPNIKEAEALFEAGNFFGPNEWLRFFGKKFRMVRVPKIPWTFEELAAVEADRKHLLFLGVENLDGKPLTLAAWHEMFSAGGEIKFESDWYLSHKFAKTGKLQTRWYLMPEVDFIGGLPNGHEIPSTLSRVTANILYHLLNGEYLDSDSWARTAELTDGGSMVYVRGYQATGISVFRATGPAKARFGIAASLKVGS